MLLPWTAPANWTAIVGLDVNRNAAFGKSPRLGQRDAALNLEAVLVLRHGCFVAEVFRAKTLVAMTLRIHSLAFSVSLSLEVTSRELVDVII